MPMRFLLCLALFSPVFAQEERTTVSITADGRVLRDGVESTLADLSWVPAGAAVEVHADHDAIWMHVQWALAMLAEKGHAAARVVTRDAPSRVRIHRGRFEHLLFLDTFDDTPTLAIRVGPGPTYEAGCWPEPGKTTTDLATVREWIRTFPGKDCAIEPDALAPWQTCADVLAEFTAAGIDEVQWGMSAPHPWVRRQRILPVPESHILWHAVFTDMRALDVEPLSLPLAPWALEDKDDDPDDRVIVNLTAAGEIVVGREVVGLQDLARWLDERKAEYDARCEQLGRTGLDEIDGKKWSKLFVLLRVDKDAPWQWVRRLFVLEDRRFYKIQLAVDREATRAHGKDEAAAVGLPPPTRIPDAGDRLSAKIQAFRSTNRVPTRSWTDVKLAADLAKVEVADGVRFDAPDDLPWKHVVAAVNALLARGVRRFDFARIEPPPPDARFTPPAGARRGASGR